MLKNIADDVAFLLVRKRIVEVLEQAESILE